MSESFTNGIFYLQLGPYGGNFARVDEDRKDARIIILGEGDEKGRKWELTQQSDHTVTFKNLKTGTYLSFEGDPHVNKPGFVNPKERKWQLRQSSLPGNYHLVVPGGPIDGEELVFDASLLRIFPPQTALRPIRPTDIAQTWKLIPANDD